MTFDKRKIANSFYLPKYKILHGIASLLDFTHSECDEFTDEILSRSIEDDMRADWEAVGASLWWAIGEHEKPQAMEQLRERRAGIGSRTARQGQSRVSPDYPGRNSQQYP